jgi:hypothetical protein
MGGALGMKGAVRNAYVIVRKPWRSLECPGISFESTGENKI